METKIKISIHSIAILLALDLQIPVCACHTAIAVETHHSVTKGSVILVKNVTFVMTELMAPAARAEMASLPKKMAHVTLMMEEMNNCACHIAIAVETHHSVTKGCVVLVKNVTFVMTELMAPAARAEMVSLPKKMA